MTNITDLKQEKALTPLLRLGFRPFFLFGGLFALCSMIIWLLSLSGLAQINPVNGILWWHSHEMLFGFVPAIIAGFLLTAVQTWTGVPSVKGNKLLLLLLVWLLGRTLLLFNFGQPIWLTLIVDLVFLPLVGIFLAIPLVRVKQTRNMIFLPLIFLMSVANLLTYLPSFGFDAALHSRGLYSMTLLTTLLVALLGGRVIPMFTANGTNTTKVFPVKWLEWGALSSLFLIFLFFALGLTYLDKVLGFLCALSATLHLYRNLRWRPWVSFKVPLVLILHLSMMFIPIGLSLMSAHFLLGSLSLSTAIHSLTVGVIGGMIIAMMSRVSLGHTGRRLQVHFAMVFAFGFIILAALMRSFFAAIMPEFIMYFWLVSGVLWCVTFLLFVAFYFPILSSSRIDGRPG